jgi:conjugal transfer pilus assembly protein TraF
MIRFLLFVLFMLNTAIAAPSLAAAEGLPQAQSANNGDKSWWDGTPWHDPDRGFNWYPPDKPRPPKKVDPKNEARPKTIKEMTTMEDVRKELERLKSLAILKPTNENVLAYLDAQQWVMNKSSVFADVARRVVWQNPAVDYNNRSPVANFALSAKRDMRSAEQRQTLADLSKDYGLMFFFRSDCPYCHQQAPILRLLERQYGLPVKGVSLDGGPIPYFEDAIRDNGLSMMISGGQGVQTVPAVFLVHRGTMTAVQIGSGVLAMDDIVERVRVLTRTKPGEEF